MRFLIVAAAVFACAAAAPSGALLAAPYSAGLVAHGAPLAYAAVPAALPVNSGDIQGAAIDAHVQVSDHVRAVNDQAAEIQGRAINAAEDHAWSAVNAAQVAAAQIDGVAANVSPVAARQLAGHGVVAPVVAAPAVAAYSAPWVAPAISAYSAPVVAPAISAYSAPVIAGVAGSHSVSVQSLSQSHPAPLVHAPLAYAAHGLAHAW